MVLKKEVFVSIFQNGGKQFKYSRIRNMLTFEVIIVILACMIRAFFTQNDCFLLLGFWFVCLFFVSLQRASGEYVPKQKTANSSFSRKVSAILWMFSFEKIWTFLRNFQSEFRFNSSKCLRNSAANL